MKFNLKNTPIGDYMVEFYSLKTAQFPHIFESLADNYSEYNGEVKNCRFYPNVIFKLHKRCSNLDRVKITKI